MRRSHVSKEKGSPFLQAETDNDTSPLIMSLPNPSGEHTHAHTHTLVLQAYNYYTCTFAP